MQVSLMFQQQKLYLYLKYRVIIYTCQVKAEIQKETNEKYLSLAGK